LRTFVSSGCLFGSVPRLFPSLSLSLLRLAADEVCPQRFGEALTRGGVARAGGTRQSRNSAIRLRPVIGSE
jgi:hypothetical protein